MDNFNDETQRLVNGDHNNQLNNSNNSNLKPNSRPIPANRLALDAQIQAAAEHQRRLRQRRRIYYIILITSVTMITFSILCFVAWILHNGTANGKGMEMPKPNNEQLMQNTEKDVLVISNPSPDYHKSTLNARRKPPTRTTALQSQLVKRSEMESDEEKEESEGKKKKTAKNGRKPTRTRQLSFAPEMVIDYKPQFRPIQK